MLLSLPYHRGTEFAPDTRPTSRENTILGTGHKSPPKPQYSSLIPCALFAILEGLEQRQQLNSDFKSTINNESKLAEQQTKHTIP